MYNYSDDYRFTNSFIYYGLSLNTGTLVGSVYLNTFLSGAVEVPANLLCILTMEKIGRRITLGGGFLVGGISCLLMIISIGNDGKHFPCVSRGIYTINGMQ